MTNLGKQTVILRVLLNGVPHRTVKENKVVYQKADGTFWVNWLNGKRQVTRSGDEFVQISHVRTVPAVDVVAMLKAGP